MPQITGLYTFPSGQPVDPAQLNNNFGTVANTFNESVGALEAFAKAVTLTAIGAKGDAVTVGGGAMTAGSTALSTAAAAFSAADVGKVASVAGAGASGAPLVTVISGYTSATQVTLSSAASTTVSGAAVTFGSDNSAAFGALAPGTYLVPAGLYLFAGSATVADGVVLVFAEGARLTRVGFATLALRGEIVAGRYPIIEAEAGFLAGSRPKNAVVFPEWFGVKANAAMAAGGDIAAGSAALTTSAAAFTAADVGKQVEVPGAGAGGATLATTIAAYTSATQVTLAASASTTVTGKTVTFGTDDTVALNRAIAAAGIFAATAQAAGAAGGGVVLLRAGTYLVNTTDYVRAAANVSLVGAGRGATVLKHAAAGAYAPMLDIESVQNVTVEEIGFDYAEGPSNITGSIIGLLGTDTANITIRGCRFFDSTPPSGTPAAVQDRFAVALAGSNALQRIRVIDNECRDRIQLTAGGGIGVKYLWIERNYVEDAEQNAIAVSSAVNNSVFEYIYIRGNYVKGTRAVGIYVGEDAAANTGQSFRYVYIVDNVVDGFSYDLAGSNVGIYCTAVDLECADYEIRGNSLRGQGATQHVGIALRNRLGGTRTFRRVVIDGNRVDGFEKAINASTLHDASVTGNVLTRTGGGAALYFDGTDYDAVSVTGNRSTSFGVGCWIRAGKFDLAGNALKNNSGSGSAGLLVRPQTGETASVSAEGNFLGDDQATHTQQYGIQHDTTGGGAFDCRYVDNDLRGVTGSALASVDEAQRVVGNQTGAATGLIGPRWERVIAPSLTFAAPAAVPGETSVAAVAATGARAGDTVEVTAPGAVPAGFVAPYGWVSANDQVTVRWTQVSGAAATPPSGTYRVVVRKF